MRVPSSLSLLLLPGCFYDYYVGDFYTGKPPAKQERIDRDGDNFTVEEGDCNDDDARIGPEQSDECDWLDNNCDGVVDCQGDCAGLVDWGETDISQSACFEQERKEQKITADVLIVVDPSVSMEAYWGLASDAKRDLLEPLVGGKSHETHIGVITTDMQTDAGGGRLVEAMVEDVTRRFVRGRDGLTQASFYLHWALTDRIPMESGQEGVRSAILSAIQDHNEGWNAGFFQSDAKLAIIVLTDREDESQPNNPIFQTFVEDELGKQIQVHSIVSLNQDTAGAGCVGAVPAPSLLDLSARTGGLAFDICQGDFAFAMAAIGERIASEGLSDKVVLEYPAQPDSIQVFIEESDLDLTPYPWVGEVALEDDGKTLLFLGAVPPVGSRILVNYKRIPE